jgi:DNA-binding CsgD family transcriptional regulator
LGKLYYLFILLFVSVVVSGQPVITLTDTSAAQTAEVAILPDHDYSIEKILADTSLHFAVGDSLLPNKYSSYWVKILIGNPSHYTQYYNLWMNVSIHNTLYYFDNDTKKWESKEAGKGVASDKNANAGLLNCALSGNQITTLYLKMDLKELKKTSFNIKPSITIEKKSIGDEKSKIILMTWVASITALLLLFLNNLYIYYNFREKTVLNYLTAQVGAAIYITAYRKFFSTLVGGVFFTVDVNERGDVYFYNWNSVSMHVAVVLLLFGFVQLTRTYLSTKKHLPALDKLLKNGLYIYVICSAILIIINTCFLYIELYVILYDNIFVLLLIIAIVYTCSVAFKRKILNSGPFLLANLLPLTFIFSTAFYHVFISFSGTQVLFLPDLGIISQVIVFSIILVTRMKGVGDKLATTEEEARQLAIEIRDIEQRQRLLELDNKNINEEINLEKNKAEFLQQKLESNQRELASSTLYIVQKNELLAGLKGQIKDLGKLYPNAKHKGLQEIEWILQSSQYLDADWAKFKIHFEQVHPDFFANLQAKHPNLTKNEIRLYAYLHINLSTKEIAALTNIDPASVRQAKTRLNKKMMANEADAN